MQVIIINSVVCVCALIGLIMGVISFSKKKLPLYVQLVTLALGCAFLGRLYNIVMIICDGAVPDTFNMNMLATIGCFLFIFIANFGEMDSLCEKTLPGNSKYSVIGFAAPALFMAEAVLILILSPHNLVLRISYAAVLVSIMFASYFNLKHLLIHDVEGGFIKNLRAYNFMALILGLLYGAEIMLDAFDVELPGFIIYLLMSACLVLIIPVLKKRITTWRVSNAVTSYFSDKRKEQGVTHDE